MEGAVILEIVLDALQRENSKWLSPKEAAAYTKYSISQLNKWRKQGKLKAYYGVETDSPRYKRDDLDKCILPR